jgi:omega-6 fatty acid desaturase (delta-12 desaturase)
MELTQHAPPAPAGAPPTPAPRPRSWQKIVAQYQKPDVRRSLWQVANSFIPFIALWALMVLSLQVSYLLTLALAVVAAGFMTRIFIILHDCGHGSFFKSQRANNFLGSICGVFAMTPYYQWRHNHAIHHATAGDLDRRASWDVPLTYTVSEYLAVPGWKKLLYRLYRHPVVLFGIAPSLLFLVAQRFMSPGTGRRERFSVLLTNLALLAAFMVLGYFLGFATVLAVQLPIMIIGATVGVWLFYVQHQFEDTYWEHSEAWEYTEAALQGSSFYKLPRLLQWFTGNIGLHHIHHLNARIPNYALQRCHDENPEFQNVSTLTLLGSLKCVSLRLWDEETQKLVGFGHLKTRRAAG